MFYYTYVLKGVMDSKLYVGFTNNLTKRLEDHNTGVAESTKSRAPFKLVYYEACLSKTKAVKREKYFKTGFGSGFLKSRV